MLPWCSLPSCTAPQPGQRRLRTYDTSTLSTINVSDLSLECRDGSNGRPTQRPQPLQRPLECLRTLVTSYGNDVCAGLDTWHGGKITGCRSVFSSVNCLPRAPRVIHARGGGTLLCMTLSRLSHRYQHVDGTMQPRTIRSGVPLPIDHTRHPLLLATVAPAAACSVEAAT